jgi:hypothetical protein
VFGNCNCSLTAQAHKLRPPWSFIVDHTKIHSLKSHKQELLSSFNPPNHGAQHVPLLRQRHHNPQHRRRRPHLRKILLRTPPQRTHPRPKYEPLQPSSIPSIPIASPTSNASQSLTSPQQRHNPKAPIPMSKRKKHSRKASSKRLPSRLPISFYMTTGLYCIRWRAIS